MPNRHCDAEVLLGYGVLAYLCVLKYSGTLEVPTCRRICARLCSFSIICFSFWCSVACVAVFQAVKPCALAGMPHVHNRISRRAPRRRGNTTAVTDATRRIQSTRKARRANLCVCT